MPTAPAETRADPASLVGGVERPPDIPREIFDAALATVLERRRLDMRALAQELGIGRATLYRKAGNRDRLLGEVVWWLSRRAMAEAVAGARGLAGAERVVAVVAGFMRFVQAQPALRRLLEQEPEAALRVLTSKSAPVQAGVTRALERLMEEEERLGTLRLGIDRATLAYAVVRIGESFLYADVIADNEPDVDQAIAVIERLLREP